MVTRDGQPRSGSDELYQQILDDIVEYRLRPGALLPAERDLAAAQGVNRQVVREALQRLRQMHLIDVVHGGGARVRNWVESADIGLLPDLVTRADGVLRAGPAKALAHLRVAIGSDIARLAARHVTTDRTMALRTALGTLRTHFDVGEVESSSVILAAEDIWTVLAEMCENLAHRLANNAIRVAVGDYVQLAPPMYTPLPLQLALYERLVDAVLSGVEADAATTAREVLVATEAYIIWLIDQREVDTPDIVVPPQRVAVPAPTVARGGISPAPSGTLGE